MTIQVYHSILDNDKIISLLSVVYGFPLYFQLSEITIAPKQRLKDEERSTIDFLASGLTICARSVCVAGLTLWTMG